MPGSNTSFKSPSRTSITATIEEDFPIYTSFLSSLIQAPSPNPPGDTRAAVAVISSFLSKNFPGIITRIIAPQPDKPNLVALFYGDAGAGPRVILNGHVDAFPSRERRDESDDQYSGHDDGVYIHGRGGVDMKAGTAASVVAFGLLYERRAELSGSVGLMCVSDEETGGKFGSRWLLEHGEDGKTEVGVGESPWEGDCVINGEPGGLQSVRFGEKGTLRLTFDIKTEGQNGAYVFRCEGAVRMAARLIGQLLVLEEMRPRLDDALRKYLESDKIKRVADEIMGRGAGDNLLVPTVNIGTIRGGLKVNMIPEECVFEADIRLPIGLKTEEVLDQIHAILKRFPDVRVEEQEAASNPSNHCVIDHPMADCLTSAVEEITGRKPDFLTGLGGTDCKFWRYRGVPAYVLGPSPEGMATSNEAVKKEEYKTITKAYALAAFDYLEQKN